MDQPSAPAYRKRWAGAMIRQQAEVEIQVAARKDLQELRTQNMPVQDGNPDVRLHFGDPLDQVWCIEALTY